MEIVISLCSIILIVASYWKIFEKAGENGWKSIIPLYNIYVIFKIADRTKMFLASIIITVVLTVVKVSIINLIGLLALFIIIVDLWSMVAKNFGHGGLFTVGLIFLPFVFLPIIAFGSSVYVGENYSNTDIKNQQNINAENKEDKEKVIEEQTHIEGEGFKFMSRGNDNE